MIYVLIGVVLVSVAAIVYVVRITTGSLVDVMKQAAVERRALEDRLLAMTDRDASVLVHAQETFTEGDVTYIDENREWELDRDGD